MSGYETKKDELVNKHIDVVLENKVASLVNNQDMPDNKSNVHRGYIAALRDFQKFYNNDLPKQLNGA